MDKEILFTYFHAKRNYMGFIGKLVLTIALMVSYIFSYCQDIHLSQFFNTPLLRNPALAGIFTGDIRVQAVYRNQWQSIGFPYQTNVLGIEYKFPVGSGDDFMTIGGSASYDVAGIMKLKTLQVLPVINFHKSLSGNKNSYLSGGFAAGMANRQFDGKNLTFDNQFTGGRFEPSTPSGEQFAGLARTFLDVAVGLSYNADFGESGSWYLGGSLWHFNKPSFSFLSDDVTLSPKWQANAGLKNPINEDLSLIVEANFLQQGPYNEWIGGAGLLYQLPNGGYYGEPGVDGFAIGGGLYYRAGDAIIPYFNLVFNRIDLGISYDVNVSALRTATQGRGGFEVSFSYRAFAGGRMGDVRGVRCPKF